MTIKEAGELYNKIMGFKAELRKLVHGMIEQVNKNPLMQCTLDKSEVDAISGYLIEMDRVYDEKLGETLTDK